MSYTIAKNLIRVPYISLVNLIAGKEVVRELIQSDFNVENVAGELNKILVNTVYRGTMLQGYDEIKNKIGENQASETTAEMILKSLKGF
ncbi:hypothetical protein ACFSKL_18120 [Belliella marina]|uniref:Lipid-A-disaccharide synthase n=1 Tax=Belliella marina TaxID=1644146 RepID=A0ABW4VRD3_9BACT